MYFCYFVIISPWKMVGPFIWTNLNPLHLKMLCAKFDWNWPSGSGEDFFLISSMYFRYFVIISPRKRPSPSLTNLNLLHPRMLCARFGWNCPSSSGERGFLISTIYCRYFVIISPWQKGGVLYLHKLESPPPKDLCAKFGWYWPSGIGEED